MFLKHIWSPVQFKNQEMPCAYFLIQTFIQQMEEAMRKHARHEPALL